MKIAVIIPCHNEENTVKQVIHAIRKELPKAEIVCCDNNSTDGTAAACKSEKVTLIYEGKKGKGNAIKKLLKEVDADVYFLIDGDLTYSLQDASKVVNNFIEGNYDLLVGKRISQHVGAYPKGHKLGNWIFSKLIGILFSFTINDVLSGYRIFTKKFVKSWVLTSQGFEVEVDMTIHALSLGLDIIEVPVKYFPRPLNSFSKLSSYRDGFKIIFKVVTLAFNNKPLKLLSILSFIFLLIFLFSFIPIYNAYTSTGIVLKIPTLLFSISSMTLSLLTVLLGVILQNIAEVRREIKILNSYRD